MKFIVFLFLIINSSHVSGATSFQVADDDGNIVTFSKPAKRIISLSPHATELLFAAGASDQIVATISYSDFPEQAKKIPRIGSHEKIDLESVININPDLIIVWKSGGSSQQIDDIKKLGYKIYSSEPKSFESVAANIVNMGKILGTNIIANKKADSFLNNLNALRNKFHNLELVDVFYQVWNQPLMTINNGHLITDIIELCGGRNVFANLPARAPKVDIESVIEKNPQAILIGMSENRNDWIEPWFKWQSIYAVKHKHVYGINADYIVRQGPRVLKGIKQVCGILENIRNSDEKK